MPQECPRPFMSVIALIEYDDWVKERIDFGWVFGEKKDIENKVSPYLVPYDELTEEIKEYDRDTIRNIPELLELVGMKIIEKNASS
jgi:hypothetical protein